MTKHFAKLIKIGAGLVASLFLWASSIAIAQNAGDAVFKLGVINERVNEPDFTLAQYGKLRDSLSIHLQPHGIQVAPLTIARDVPDMADKLIAQKVDAVLESLFPTLDIERRTGQLQAALLVWRKGQREYHTVFFSRRDGPVATLADLRGRTLVFETPRSTSAYGVPKAYLHEQGFVLTPADQTAAPTEVVRYVFAGAELNQAHWVLHGKGDAGAFNNGDWERLPATVQEQLRIIARTPPIPRYLLSFRQGLSPEIQKTVEETLIDMHQNPAGREALKAASNIQKFERLTPADQDQLAQWRKILTPQETP